MKIPNRFIFFVVAVLAVAVIAATDARYQTMSDNEKHLKRADELVKLFEKEKEPETLREAGMELEDVDLRRVHDMTLRHKQRNEALEMWLTIIQTLDNNLDANFDPDNVPQMSVMPPRTKSGVQYPPGVAPDMIDDPKAREEYEKAVQDNRAKQEAYLLQHQLRELNETIPPKVESFIRDAFTSADHDDIKAVIDRTIESKSRRQSLYPPMESLEEGA
jgi:hypothetical protein